MSERIKGFEPFFNRDSEVLILGSFPSIMSRQQSFYYGNPRNDFWRLLASAFGRPVPQTVSEKKDFLCGNKVALWDIVTCCEIRGSADSSIKNYQVADLGLVLDACSIKRIILNGGTAYKIFLKHYANLPVPYIKLPSTSPANTSKKEDAWLNELRTVFGIPQ